jgi:hypothetical protein
LAGSSLVAGTGLVEDFIVRQRIALANQTVRRSAGISSLNFNFRHFSIRRDDHPAEGVLISFMAPGI